MVASSGYGHAVADELSSDPMMRREPSMTRDMMSTRRDSQVRRAPNSSGLYDVLDLILDKGIVIDAFVRVSLVGIELLTVDLRVVIASVDTYLRYAEGVERLQVYDRSGSKRLPDMVGSGMKTHALKKGAEKVGQALTGKSDDDDNADDENEHEGGGLTGTLTRGVRNVVGRIIGSGDDDDDADDDNKGRKQPDRAPEHRRRLPDADRHQTPGRGGKPVGARR
jgi:hypothetical protein